MTTLSFIVNECEHDGDVDEAASDIEKSGATIVRTELNEDAECCLFTVEIGNRTDFLRKFRLTETHEFVG